MSVNNSTRQSGELPRADSENSLETLRSSLLPEAAQQSPGKTFTFESRQISIDDGRTQISHKPPAVFMKNLGFTTGMKGISDRGGS